MFDVLFIKDFKNQIDYRKFKFQFQKLPYYNEVKKVQYDVILQNACCSYLERIPCADNYFFKDFNHIFIFGSVFTNKKHAEVFKNNLHIIRAKEILDLYCKLGLSFVEYIKGSFCILLYNESKEEIILISDRHNVLPVYIYKRNDILIISSSIKAIMHTELVELNYDKIAFLQQLLFDYTLDDFTIFREIKRVKPATIYIFKRNYFREELYYSIENLYNEKLLPRKESLDRLAEQLFKNVQLLTSDKEKILVSLTGGFDGRTNVSMLRKNTDDFLCYSYGMANSRQINIPMLIAKKLGINYQPIYCDESFEREYVSLGLKVTEFSNGTAPFTQAVMPYAYEKLSSFSDTILTGLFGSEVLRALHNLGIIINDYSERIFLHENPEKELPVVINELISFNFFKDGFFDKKTIEEFKEHFIENYLRPFNSYGKIIRFFFFIIGEGIRKYFSQELQAERVYVSNTFPYFDHDFLDLIYQTSYAGMYNGFLGKSKYKRRKGQLLYAHIMKKYYPDLLKIKLDRGYNPGDLLKPFPINYLMIGWGVLNTKRYYKKIGNDTFNTPVWAQKYLEFSRAKFNKSSFLSEKLLYKPQLMDEKKFLKIAYLISIKNYLENEQ